MSRKNNTSSGPVEYRGGARYRNSRGLVTVLLTLEPAEREAIKSAAADFGVPVSRFLRMLVLDNKQVARFLKKD